MKTLFPLWTFRRGSMLALSLVIALLAVSCAPAATTETTFPEQAAPVDSAPATEAVVPAVEPTAVVLTDPTELPPFVPHGDSLVATDPTTVSLASGGLQLVEFFRFT
jgi:hypothetical protein